ncbi:PREDICTED: uncharacterized protein LOC102847970 [Elephantulus edwardii]|uniref:uncharacterized protein LOC102847970 n=1 Tax=Elephantulus edwardii TaxID=28737 RepID=UPI0003F09B65|nr:PREDICTED: uncharacterized protein LOC102847970 [Elephantulus edwardii]
MSSAEKRLLPPPGYQAQDALPGPCQTQAHDHEKEECHPPDAGDDLRAPLRRPRPSLQLGTSKKAPREAWLDPSEVPAVPGQANSCPMWSAGEEPESRDHGSSSVSSGRLSGSSGGHECTLPPRVWKERPPQVMRPPRQPRQSDPQLERLRDKIRAQAAWPTSCGSLGASAPCGASRFCKGTKLGSRKKVRKVAHVSAIQTRPDLSVPRVSAVEDKTSPGHGSKRAKASQRQASDSESVGVYAWRKGPALVKLLLGPHSVVPRRQSLACSPEPAHPEELGDSKAIPVAAHEPAPARTPSPAQSDQQVSPKTPSLASLDQPATIQTAMAILQDLRWQIQAGLDLARHFPVGRLKSVKRHLPKSGEQGAQGDLDVKDAFSRRFCATSSDKGKASQSAWGLPGQPPCSTPTRVGSSPQRAWTAESRRTTLCSFPPRPWSTSADLSCENQEPPIHRSWNLLERQTPPAWRPWSTSDGFRDWTASVRTPRNLVEGPGPLAQGPKSRPFVHWTETPLDAPGKANVETLAAGGRSPGAPGPERRSASLRAFMKQRALARRRQEQEEKAAAERALELRTRRLQEVYRKQREAVLRKPGPVVSQTQPGIVTFVQHATQPEDTDSSRGLGSPVLERNKVTSGKVTKGPKATGSFCLCLNKAFSHPKTPKEEAGSPLQLSADASMKPWKLQDPPPQLCIHLDPKSKQARLQALENTANTLRHRIDALTAKLQQPWTLDTLLAPGPDLPLPVLPSPEPAVPSLSASALPAALVPSGKLVALPSPCYPLDSERLPWSSGPERRPGDSPWHQYTGKSQGQELRVLEQRLARAVGSSHLVHALESSCSRVPATRDSLCSSSRLEDVQAARRASSGMLWNPQTLGRQGTGELHLGDLSGNHFTSIQQKSLSFLETMKEQVKQLVTLALLRQRAENEVLEMQAALDPPHLQPRIDTHSTQARSEKISVLEQPQACGDLDTPSVSPGPMKEAEHPNTASSQLPPSRLGPWKDKKMQEGRNQGLGLKMLEQSLQEEELRAQHQAALMRLREKALEEKARAELEGLEHQRSPGSASRQPPSRQGPAPATTGPASRQGPASRSGPASLQGPASSVDPPLDLGHTFFQGPGSALGFYLLGLWCLRGRRDVTTLADLKEQEQSIMDKLQQEQVTALRGRGGEGTEEESSLVAVDTHLSCTGPPQSNRGHTASGECDPGVLAAGHTQLLTLWPQASQNLCPLFWQWLFPKIFRRCL